MVAMAWLCNISSVHNHMWTENGILYSYTTPIGYAVEIRGQLHAILTIQRYSSTTSRHANAAAAAIRKFPAYQMQLTLNIDETKRVLERIANEPPYIQRGA